MKNLSLTYCTNVHPLGDWATWSEIVGRFGPSIRDHLGWTSMPMGLWFPASLIEEMNRDPENARDRLKDLLARKNLSVFTCNAFPYGNFHEKTVKTKVYHPDWTTPERLGYTVSVSRLLAALIPPGGEGSVSTLPLGWRIGWTEEHFRKSADNICTYVREARGLADVEGRTIRLGLEPEPGCVMETLRQVIDFWTVHLRPAAKRSGITSEDLDEFCGICYDTCHQAVQFEEPADVLDKLKVNGIRVVKMQLSSALEFPPDPERTTLALRRQFVEERFLHQTRIKTPGGMVSFDDLPEALAATAAGAAAAGAAGEDLWSYPWRVHFHLPIDSQSMLDSSAVSTTRDDMLKAYRYAVDKDRCRHFEVETYTWNVLPEAHRPKDDAELARSIAGEIRFIENNTPSGFHLNRSEGKAKAADA
ncbi:MAG: metabolite traffic protein EboE [Fibrobacterota bacterium]|nr:metabolite traffic protein EboE [Fibrobacterota bacterium]